MGVRSAIGAVILVGACKAQLSAGPVADSAQSHEDAAARFDAPVPVDTALGAWGAPTPVTGASTPTNDTDNETLNTAMTEMYFTIVDTAITGHPKQLWLMTRATANDPWGTPAPFAVANGGLSVQTESPRLSPDDLTLYFGRAGDIYTTTRSAVGGAWTTPTALASVNTAAYEKWLAVCDNNYFVISRANGVYQDLYEGRLGSGVGAIASELNAAMANQISTFLSKDCLTIYFASDRGGSTQLYTATRATPTSAWTTPTMVTEFGTAAMNKDLWVSDDQRTAFLATIRDGRTLRAVYTSVR